MNNILTLEEQQLINELKWCAAEPNVKVPYEQNAICLLKIIDRLTAQLAAEKKYSERQSKESLKREIDIQGLYERISAVQAERDAAVADFEAYVGNEIHLCNRCQSAIDKSCSVSVENPSCCKYFKWRGVPAPSGAEGEKHA